MIFKKLLPSFPRDKAKIKGKVTAVIFDENMRVKRFNQSWLRWIFGLPGKEMIFVTHNIVTNHGDALIADAMSNTQARTKVDTSNGVIGVGTGFSSATKSVTALVTQAGSNEAMDATYPKLKGAFNATDDNVTQYRATFEAGDLNATGIDEVALGNGTDLLAYAGITSFNVTSADTLQMNWELTFLGA